MMDPSRYLIRFLKDKHGSEIDRDSILLDTGSNCSVFNNEKLLTNVRKSSNKLVALTNGGEQVSRMKGTLPGFFDVWFNPESMLNILSFAEVKNKYRLTIDTAVDNSIRVHMDDDKTLHFEELESGLYILKTNNTNHLLEKYSFLNLISDNKLYFSKREVDRAEEARKLYLHCNMPGQKRFMKLVEKNYFRDSRVTVEDVKRAVAIYGKEEAELQGGATRQRPQPLATLLRMSLTETIKDLHSEIPVSADFLLYRVYQCYILSRAQRINFEH